MQEIGSRALNAAKLRGATCAEAQMVDEPDARTSAGESIDMVHSSHDPARTKPNTTLELLLGDS
jgi:hypothetical protein